jgi:hypothetical protein
MPPPVAAQNGNDVPDATIPLASLGYEPAPAHILLAEGYTVSSLQYLDAHHLLFTYNKRSLIKRMPDDSPDQNPQNVAAILLETPSGKVLAQAEWRLHDHAQYLWSIGEGTFLLRIGRELRLLTPLAENNPAEALHGKMLMTLPGQAAIIAVSPDGRMVLVESAVPVQTAEEAPAAAPPPATSPIGTPLGNPPVPPPAPPEDQTTDVQFLDFDLSRQAQGIVNVNRVGHIIAPTPLMIPLIHDGYVHATEIYSDDWNLIYTELSGKDTVLGDVVSTCRPGAAFLSNNEILVETCNGHDTALIMTVVTLGKKELWQHALEDAGTEPSIHTTPAGGRFAVSRILLNGVASPGVDLSAETDVRMQRVDVMDIQNGALVASVVATPAERTAQNFSLSADGRHLAVLQKDTIALYDLAPIQDFPAAKIKPNDVIFVAAPEGASASTLLPKATRAGAAPSVAAAPAVIEVPLNVDAQRAPPTLLTPEEQRSVESKKNKQITLQPITPPPDPKKKPKDQQQP